MILIFVAVVFSLSLLFRYERTHRSKAGGKFPGMEITSALIKKYEELADLDNGTCDLVINSSAKGLIKDAVGRVSGIRYVCCCLLFCFGKLEVTLIVVLRPPYMAKGEAPSCQCLVGSVARCLCQFMLTCAVPMTHHNECRYQDGDGAMVEVLADAVVLATGGYGAGGQVAGSLLEKVRPDLMHLPTTNGDHSLGDGIAIALDIGAKSVALKHVQVHPTGEWELATISRFRFCFGVPPSTSVHHRPMQEGRGGAPALSVPPPPSLPPSLSLSIAASKMYADSCAQMFLNSSHSHSHSYSHSHTRF